MKKKLLLDASVWIAFFNEMDAPSILREIKRQGYELFTTQYVLSELITPSIDSVIEVVGEVHIINVNADCIWRYNGVLHGLSEADISIICATLFDEGLIAITDDGLLRKHLRRIIGDERVHGSLWIIKDIALKNGIISKEEALTILWKLKNSGFRIPKDFKL